MQTLALGETRALTGTPEPGATMTTCILGVVATGDYFHAGATPPDAYATPSPFDLATKR